MKRSFNDQVNYQLDCIGSRVMGWFNLTRWCSCSRLLAFSLLLLMLHDGGVAQVSEYRRTFLHGEWTDPIWERWDATGDTLLERPVGPDGGGHSQIRTNVYVSGLVTNSGLLEVMYWAGGLHVSGTFTNSGTMHVWSRNDMETTGSGEIRNTSTIEMHPEGGYGPVISGKLYNSGTIHTNTGWGGSQHLGNLFDNAGGTLDIEPGTDLYVGSTGTALGGTINVGASGSFSFSPSNTVELSASFSGTGVVGLGGSISVSSGTVSIGNPVGIGIKLGAGTIAVTTALNGLSILAEGTVEIGAGCSAGGIGSIGGTLINHGSVYIGYGVPQGSGLFYNSGQIIWDYDYNQYSSVNFENHGTFRKRGTEGAILTGNFEHCVDSAFKIHVQSGWLQIYNSVACTTPMNSLTSSGGTIRVDSGAEFIVPSFDFSGDTVDNRGTITSNPFRFVRSDPPQVLTGGGLITNLDVSGGNVQFLGPQTTNNLTLTSGKLQLQDSDLNLGSGGLSGANDSNYIVTNGEGRLIRNVGTSFVEFPVGTITSYNPVTVKTGTGNESFAVSVAAGIVPSMAITSTSPAVDRTWSISETTPGGNGMITFSTQWNSEEEGTAFVRDSAEGWKNDGSWAMQSGSLTTITPAGYPAVATITTSSLSSWTVANFDTPPSYSPGVIGFGDVYLNSSGTDTVWVKNNNFFILNIDSVISTNDRFTVTPSSAVVAAAESASFEITFTPDSITNENGSVVFYSNMSSSPDTVSVAAVGSLATVNVPLSQGWNLISNPVSRNPGTDSVHHLYPGSDFDYAFGFESSSGYFQRFTLENGVGFWGKFSSPDTNAITGLYKPTDSVIVNPGWNIIGTVTDPVDTVSVVSDPPGLRISPWYGYEGTYITPTVLQPGKGYWVKASAPGVFIFAPTLSLSSSRKSDGEKSNAVVDEFIVKEKSGVRQVLNLESVSSAEGKMAELPPPGPEGTFDVRFESQKSIESMNENGGKVILIRSSHFPVTFSWDTHDRAYILRDGVTGTLFPPRTISGKGEMTITNPAVTRLLLTLDDAVPHEFTLSQNYPNPFNPSTEIKFSVGKAARTSMEVFDVLGQRVAVLFNENAEPGKYYTARMDGLNMASGVYFYTLRSGSRVDTRKMILLK